MFPAAVIGFLMASEFIGTTVSVGTAQKAFESGISAAWNIVALGVGFVLFSVLLARKYRELGELTISGALAQRYGDGVRVATSVVMICALLIVSVSVYSSGGALLANLLGIDKTVAIVLVGVLATLYVSAGGMRSVVYTNLLHAAVMMAGIILLAVFATNRVGGLGELTARLPADMFSPTGVGTSQILAWMLAGVGATFATQYIVQAITTVGDSTKAQRAGFCSALVLIAYGLMAALIGVCAAALFPGIDSIGAMPALIVDLNPLLAGFVVSGLAGAMFGTIAALNLGASTLLLKDFYERFFNASHDERRNLVFIRVAAAVAGLLPIVLALFASDVLAVTFLAKALRATLAVLVLLMFYAPRFGTSRGALWTIAIALVATIGWFLAGAPFGLDPAYVAVAVPLVVMSISHVLKRDESDGPTVTAAPGAVTR